MGNSHNAKLELTFDRRIFLYCLVILLAIAAVYFFRGIFAMLFIAYIISSGLRPLVDRLEANRVPRIVSIICLYVLGLVAISAIIIITANSFIEQVQNLLNALPLIADNVTNFLRDNVPAAERILPLDAIKTEVRNFTDDTQKSSFFTEIVKRENVLVVASGAYGVFGSVADVLIRIFTVLMVSGYMLNRKDFYQPFISYIPARRKATLRRTFARIEESLGTWIVGQLMLMLFIGLLTYFVLIIPGWFFESYQLDQYALPIALLAAVLEAVPNIGPLITGVIAAIFALGTTGIGAVVYISFASMVLQNIEATLLVPLVMKRAVGLDPIISILAIIAGFQVYGVLGAVLVIPLVGIGRIVLSELMKAYVKDQQSEVAPGQIRLDDVLDSGSKNS